MRKSEEQTADEKAINNENKKPVTGKSTAVLLYRTIGGITDKQPMS